MPLCTVCALGVKMKASREFLLNLSQLQYKEVLEVCYGAGILAGTKRTGDFHQKYFLYFCAVLQKWVDDWNAHHKVSSPRGTLCPLEK